MICLLTRRKRASLKTLVRKVEIFYTSDMKTCFKCHITKPLSEFYRHPKMSDGHLNKCKSCTKKDTQKRTDYLRANDPEWVEDELARQRLKERKRRELGLASPASPATIYKWRKNNPQKRAAHSAVQYALESGKLQKLPCSVCGVKNAHAHHDDYSKPLDVIWLCSRHHHERHVLLRQQQRALKRLQS
jgi:hypothetical protein